jgi:hypothetical protein
MKKAGKLNGNGASGSKAEAPPPLSSRRDSQSRRQVLATALGRHNRNHDFQLNGKGAHAALSAEATLRRLDSSLSTAGAQMSGDMDASDRGRLDPPG